MKLRFRHLDDLINNPSRLEEVGWWAEDRETNKFLRVVQAAQEEVDEGLLTDEDREAMEYEDYWDMRLTLEREERGFEINEGDC